MKKFLYGLIAIILIAVIFFVSARVKTNKAYYIQENIKAGEAIVVDTMNGDSGYELDDATLGMLLEKFETYEFRWKIDLRPRGGWSYRFDLEIEGQVYRIVYNGNDYLKIDSDEFFISEVMN